MANILLCDDERNLRDLLALALSSQGHQVEAVADGRKALAVLDGKGIFDLVITDLRLPDISGLDVLRHAKRLNPHRPVLLITAYASTETAVTAMREGAFDYLEKPFRVEDLALVLARALEQYSLRRENLRLKKELDARTGSHEIIGNSQPMRHIMEIARRVARTDTTVLITGESGTGKELIARAVHQFSERASAPFVAINCAAIPETLMESELFGHVKGAFSGALNHHKGVFEQATNGTLLLDEIGEMAIGTQAKLLRVLQERTVRRVGDSKEQPVEARVIATTNRDLAKEVSEGGFREDLYYRINVVRINAPSLRERLEDIPLLVNRFVENFRRRHQTSVKGVSPEFLDALMKYPFPGNVRELENLIEGSMAMAMEDRLDASCLPDYLRFHARAQTVRPCISALADPLPDGGIDLEGFIKDFEIRMIQEALEKAGGVKTRAAELLGLSFRSFRYRLSKLGLESGPGSEES